MKTNEQALSAERLRALLDYNPETGIFTWKTCRGGGSPEVGEIAGTKGDQGYQCILIRPYRYKAHRLAWLYVHGKWPAGQIDHKDGVPDHNWIANLRLATISQNCSNRIVSASSGLKGAYYHKHSRIWYSSIGKNGKQIHLGTYDTAEEAHAAYVKAANKLFGEFARIA